MSTSKRKGANSIKKQDSVSMSMLAVSSKLSFHNKPKIKPVVRQCGFEAPESLVFSSWEVGATYTKHITLKNTEFRMLQIQVSSPTASAQSRGVFSVESSAMEGPIKISSGTVCQVTVKFAPVERIALEEHITIATSEGYFDVSIRATLPVASLIVPTAIKMPLVSVSKESTATFTVENPSKVRTTWLLEVEQPFAVSPSSGALDPGSQCVVMVSFLPVTAGSMESMAVLKYDGGDGGTGGATINLRGQAQYPHILIDATMVEFGETFTGKTSSREIKLKNVTDVTAEFTIAKSGPNADQNKRFTLTKDSGTILPGKTFAFKVKHTPLFAGEDFTEHFKIDIAAGLTIDFSCHGSSCGPKVSLSHDLLHFKAVCGAHSSKTFSVVNDSEMQLSFQVLDGGSCVFQPCQHTGTLAPKSSHKITITYSPTLPIRYHDTLTILVGHHRPLLLHLIAVAIDEKFEQLEYNSEPHNVHRQHIDNFRKFQSQGILRLPPSLVHTGTIPENMADPLLTPQSRSDTDTISSSDATSPAQDGTDASNTPSANTPTNGETPVDMAEKIDWLIHPSTMVSVSTRNINFGSCPSGSKKRVNSIEPRFVSMKNNSFGDLALSWLCSNDVFSITPTHALIAPGASQQFTVQFRPVYADQFYHANLDCYLDYAEVLAASASSTLSEDVVISPIHESLALNGHTFNIAPPSKLSWQESRLDCPPAHVDTSSYTSVILRNEGDISSMLMFAQTTAENGTEIECLPTSCIVPPHGKQLVTFKVHSTVVGYSEHSVTCTINNEETHDLTIISSVHEATLELGNEAKVFIPPASVGVETSSELVLHNPTGAAISYHWDVTDEVGKHLAVSPSCGVLQPNQRVVSVWTFVAPKVGNFGYCVPCNYGTVSNTVETDTTTTSPSLTPTPSTLNGGLKTISAVIAARCAKSLLQAFPKAVDFGDVMFDGGSQKQVVTLYNPTAVAINYSLVADDDTEVYSLSHTEGTLPSLGRVELLVSCKPKKESVHQAQFYYKINGAAKTDFLPLFKATLNTVTPQVAITNAFSTTSSKREIWERFNIAKLNECFEGKHACNDDLDVSTINTRTMFTTNGSDSNGVVDVVVCNFGVAVSGTSEKEVSLELTNVGDCVANWNLLFPEEMQYLPEPWAKHDNPDEDEVHQTRLLHNKTFYASPMGGTLNQQSSSTIKFRYKHDSVAQDSVIVFLEIGLKQKIALVLEGETLPTGIGFLNDFIDTFPFEPVAIGSEMPPVQHISLRNDGDEALTITNVDTSELTALAKANYSFQIFSCGTLPRSVAAGAELIIPVRFHPIEAKEYTAGITLDFADDVPSRRLCLVGVGCDPRVEDATSSVMDAQLSIPSRPYGGGIPRSLSLTAERIHFGSVASNSRSQRMFFVCNTHPQGHLLAFKFSAGHYGDAVSFDPAEGTLRTGESQSVRMHLRPTGPPRTFNFDAICEVTDLNHVAEFRAQTLTAQDGGDVAANPLKALERPSSATLLASISKGPSGATGSDLDLTSDLDLRTSKYHALPPIKKLSASNAQHPKPVASPPEVYFIGVSAKVFPCDDVEVAQQYVDRAIGGPAALDDADFFSSGLNEDQVITEVLGGIFQEIINADDVAEALTPKYVPKPLFFNQLVGGDSANAPLPPASLEAHGQPDVLAFVEDVLENTFANLMAEAESGDFDLTARTRQIVSRQ